MSGRRWLLLGGIIAAIAGVAVSRFARKAAQPAPESAYIDSRTCAACHREIWDRFARTGMGRSMRPASAATMPAGFREHVALYHKASDRHYSLLERDGKFYQRRHQMDGAGREVNVFEREIHYVVGSGNHAKSFLSRS